MDEWLFHKVAHEFIPHLLCYNGQVYTKQLEKFSVTKGVSVIEQIKSDMK